MNLNDLRSSRYLKKEDAGAGILVTIKRIAMENVAKEGDEPDNRGVVYFDELDKPMVLNSTNGQIISKITGHETDIEHNWIGTRVVLYSDPNVSFGGRLVGGLRVRAPKRNTATTPRPAQPGQVSATRVQPQPAAETRAEEVAAAEGASDDLPF